MFPRPDLLDALVPEGVDYSSKVRQGAPRQKMQKGTSLASGSGAVEPDSSCSGPSSFLRERRASPALLPGEGAGALAEALPSSTVGGSHRVVGPVDRGLALQGSQGCLSGACGTCSQTCLGSLGGCTRCPGGHWVCTIGRSGKACLVPCGEGRTRRPSLQRLGHGAWCWVRHLDVSVRVSG